MNKTGLSPLKSWLKSAVKILFITVLAFVLTFSYGQDALAARSGGRIGGGSFRSPSRTYSAPSRGYSSTPVYSNRGWGFGFPFLIPFFGFGGGFGGLFSIFIIIAIANFLVKTLRNSGAVEEIQARTSQVSVAKVQVGLLAQARDLKQNLDRLAQTADTATNYGRAKVLQEVSLALLRHPEYWVYGATESQKSGMEAAEAKFNQLALAERSKFSAETLSNVDSIKQKETLPPAAEALAKQLRQEAGEYIIITLLVGVEGDLKLPKINASEQLNQALETLGGIGSDRLLVLEVLWTPQAEGDTLSTDDILAYYPDLNLV